MRDATVHPQWLTHVLAQRDGAYAMDALRDIARQANSPSLAVAERELASRGDPLCDQAVAAVRAGVGKAYRLDRLAATGTKPGS